MPFHPVTNLQIQKYYQNNPEFNAVYPRNNLSKIMDGAFILILMSMNQ